MHGWMDGWMDELIYVMCNCSTGAVGEFVEFL